MWYVDGCPNFRPISSALQIPTYKLAKYLASILEKLTSNKYSVKDLFNFATEIVEQDCSNFMGSLGTDSQFTRIFLEETIEMYIKNPYKHSDIVHSHKKDEYEDILSLAATESYFIFNNILYKQIHVAVTGYLLGSLG